MTYRYGETHGAASLAVQHELARLKRALRERDHQVIQLQGRLDRRRRDDANRAPAYRDTLTPDEFNARPVLRHGDTPAICAARLEAANAEANERSRHNRSAAQTHCKAA